MTDSKTSDRDVNRAIRSWLHEDRHEDASRVAGAVLDHVEATPRRRATWWPARRTPTMNKFLAIGLGAAAVVVILLVGSQLLGSPANLGGPGIEPTPTATPEPTASPEPSPSAAAGLPEGPHLLSDGTNGGPPITVTIPAPLWYGETNAGGMCWDESGHPTCAGPPEGAGIIAFPGTDSEFYVFADPCAWSSTKPETPATTVDELVAALANQASREASAPEDITLDGYAGKKIILQMADDVADFGACDEDAFVLFGVAGEDQARYSQGPGQIEEVWAVDVDGQIVILDGLYYPDTPQNAVDELRAILASATFEVP
jgi:hypothetical protein